MSIPYHVGQPLTCDQMRELDTLVIEQVGIPGVVLMENAGRGVSELIYATLLDPPQSHVLIMCGAGNNGGDGFVVARHLHNADVPVVLALATPPERVRGDAAINLQIAEHMGIRLVSAFEPAGLEEARAEAARADVIVDALLGTGSRGAPRGVLAELVQMANRAPRARRVAIDIPSGLDGDTGSASEPCFRAHATVTMAAAKLGLTVPAAAPFVGRLVVVDIGVPRELIRGHRSPGQGG